MNICFIPPLERTDFLENSFDIYGRHPKIDRFRRKHNIEWGKRENHGRANGEPPFFIRSFSYSNCIRKKQKNECHCWVCQGVRWGLFEFKDLGLDNNFLIYGIRGN